MQIGKYIINNNPITHIDLSRRKIYIHHNNGVTKCYLPLKSFESDVFIRVHRSLIVNSERVAHYDGHKIIMDDGTVLYSSRSMRNNLYASQSVRY
ncbi:LytTR family transcriptional regulator [Erysipelothrix sp. HDW6C]|uniref:LytTR family DNA-binding domain-containing protein n=1 Tax=Erysipelothrix sp. HDW6C TaxID=2714930 RepID=UPI001408B850|nr:LytTR family transcriptional regulator [Erysipelothrix sp. HDW6C]